MSEWVEYLEVDAEAIWADMQRAYVEAGGDILYPGDEKEMLLRGVQAYCAQLLAQVRAALKMQTLRYAVGDYLDVLGELRSCPRIEASAATARVTITARASGSASVLPAGTAMTADGVGFYELAEDCPLSGFAQTAVCTVRAQRAGSAGNALRAGQELQLAAGSGDITHIVCSEAAAGGNEREEDESYRERIRAHGFEMISTGSARQYEQAAQAVSSEIVDARAVNLGAGVVGVYLLLADGAEAETITDAVEAALSARDNRPLTDSVSVHCASARPYALRVSVQADSGDRTALTQAATEYQTWQEGAIGRAFNPGRLSAMLYRAGAELVTLEAESNFDGGAAVHTVIGETEYCAGEIALDWS